MHILCSCLQDVVTIGRVPEKADIVIPIATGCSNKHKHKHLVIFFFYDKFPVQLYNHKKFSGQRHINVLIVSQNFLIINLRCRDNEIHNL